MRGPFKAGLLALSLGLSGLGGDLKAQVQSDVPRSPVLTIDSERLFSQSAYGRRIVAELEAERQVLIAEKEALEADLEAEELQLTQQRPNLPAAEFQVLAEAFDAKVQQARRAQDIKSRELGQKRDDARGAFLNFSLPVLAEIVREANAVAILERGSVFISADRIDITDQAIARMDVRVGDQLDTNAD
ncbi:MAG: OmpH family outer membrane protein [Pseudomonadota bacterium]